ncbi:MAG: AraC family transcriptional regulator, partial [Bacteroidota bacterium]
TVKLNSYVAAFHPHLPRPEYTWTDYFVFSELIKDEWRLILLINYAIYIFLSLRLFWKYWKGIAQFRNNRFTYDKYRFARNILLFLISTFIVVSIIFSQNEIDSGDHFIIIYASICVYFTGFLFLFESRFFGNSWLNDKYDTSGSSYDAEELIQQINHYLSEKKTHLQTGFTLKVLAGELNIPANYISQAINRHSNQNFNEFVNQRRIEEAKLRLGNTAYEHLNIAGIGDSVGFKSKSSFYAAFKKYTGSTPSQFLKTQHTKS